MSKAKVLCLMYHRVDDASTPYCKSEFIKHIEWLHKIYPIVAPGDPLQAPVSVMLTFDDAYFDFYDTVFPLLKRLNIKAMLGVPTKYILDNTNVPKQKRLGVPYPHGMEASVYRDSVPFCTYNELKEMSDSKLVLCASHSHSHAHLNAATTDLEQEIVQSKQLLEKHLDTECRYFIYPFGEFSKRVHKKVAAHYDLGFRIGSAMNRNISKQGQLVYRVDADAFWKYKAPINDSLVNKLNRKYWLNWLRGK